MTGSLNVSPSVLDGTPRSTTLLSQPSDALKNATDWGQVDCRACIGLFGPNYFWNNHLFREIFNVGLDYLKSVWARNARRVSGNCF